MEAFLVSAGVVALGEIGDKTQLLALLLAVRLRKPVPIILGILSATIVNHALAGIAGVVIRDAIPENILRYLVALSFFAVAAWALKPDSLDAGDAPPTSAHGAYWITTVAFFMAEMGDKTQIATAVLATRFGTLLPVIAGTTLGMLIVDVPTVLFGDKVAARIPFRMMRIATAIVFAVLGVSVLWWPLS